MDTLSILIIILAVLWAVGYFVIPGGIANVLLLVILIIIAVRISRGQTPL